MDLSNTLSKVADTLSGGLFDTIYKTVTTYFPPDMPESQKQQLQLELKALERKQKSDTQRHLAEAERLLTERIKELEGTASDLKALPIVGRVILFARGAQRPVWGFFTMYLDWRWFSEWQLSTQQQTALIAINLLVLGFLFGERAMKNVAPYVIQALKTKSTPWKP
ncbi:hypothetical protein [Sansalvadorimonas verongulae]|uniref:hypothetical protein n=1 Tax=Sansalvadorimonas verongulae TaxID=2172824 RepID=UPI0012BC3E8F|nr:hypothetical protein [Sansalvadorimonas verongulae]MTI12002.1 hypothetical protein [Sansalvadorimonas verongulae]